MTICIVKTYTAQAVEKANCAQASLLIAIYFNNKSLIMKKPQLSILVEGVFSLNQYFLTCGMLIWQLILPSIKVIYQ